MTRSAIFATMVLGFAIGSPARAGTPVPVTTCGQQVQGAGQLTADLDCTGSGDEAVKLNGTLLLNGFTLTGDAGFDVVRCLVGACRVIGPGTVTGGADGVRSDRGARVEGAAVVTGNSGDGVRTDKTAKITNASVTANGGDGVRSKTTAVLNGAVVTGNAGTGVRTDATANVKASTIDGNGDAGIDSEKTAKASASSTVNGNGFDGIRGLRVQLLDSTATGNGVDPACDVIDDCADLAAPLLPKVRGTSTCGTSRNTESGLPWGVCAND